MSAMMVSSVYRRRGGGGGSVLLSSIALPAIRVLKGRVGKQQAELLRSRSALSGRLRT